MLLVAGGGVVI